MAADNHTTIVGNLVEDPEVRFTNNGIAVTNLRVAVTQRVQQDGQWRDGDTSFFKINVWRAQAENLADSLTKGDRVMVTGRLRQRSWETPRVTSARSPSWKPTRSAPASSGPRPRSSARVSAAMVNAPKDGSGRPSAAATSTSLRHSERTVLDRRPRLEPGALACPRLSRAVAAAARRDTHHSGRRAWLDGQPRPNSGRFAHAATPIGGRAVTGPA
jgi:single-stranded DNA-binding protein